MDEHQEIRQKLVELIEPILKDSFMELVDLDLIHGHHIRIKIDRLAGKVSIDDCAMVSKKVNAIPGIEDVVKGNYSLEVSSPGMDRPLNKKQDFERFKGSKAKVITHEPVDNSNVFIGLIKDFDGQVLLIGTGSGDARIDYSNIKKANLEIDVF